MDSGAGKRGRQATGRGGSINPPVALGWLVGSIIAAGFVVVFLLLTITRRDGFAWPGFLAVIFLVWFAQQQFTETHRRRYQRWPPGWQFFWTGSPERHEVAQAWTRRDRDTAVELSRLLGIGLLVLSGVAALVFFGSTA